jgi:hypothetical protein
MAHGNSFLPFYEGYHSAKRDRAEGVTTPPSGSPEQAAFAIGARFFRAGRPMPDWVHFSPLSWAADRVVYVDGEEVRWLRLPVGSVDVTKQQLGTGYALIGAEPLRRK